MSQPEVRVVVCGEGGVGKSAISVQFINGRFVEAYGILILTFRLHLRSRLPADPTIEDSYRKQIIVDGEVAVIQIRDTAGQEQFSVLREAWYREGDGFLLVYSIVDRKSFVKLKEHVTQIVRVRDLEGTHLLSAH